MCDKILPVKNFKQNSKRKDGLQSQCISCQKEYRRKHYLKNKKKYIDKSKKWRKEFRQWWKEYKKQFSCIRCGENHPACIQFHHINDDKENDVAYFVGIGNLKKVLDEIAKCMVLCANCHAKEHWKE